MTKRILAVLLLFASVLAACAGPADEGERYAEQQTATILITYGEEEHSVDFDSILALAQHNIEVTVREEERSYKGVLLRDLLAACQIPSGELNQVVLKGAGGYEVALGPEEVLAPADVYIVYEYNGEPLKGEADGGAGPYRLVLPQDEFAQRWLKHLEAIAVR